MEHKRITPLTFECVNNLRITSGSQCNGTNCLCFTAGEQRRAVYVVEHIDFARNLAHCATVTSIDAWLTGQNTLANNAFLKGFKLVLDIVGRRTILSR